MPAAPAPPPSKGQTPPRVDASPTAESRAQFAKAEAGAKADIAMSIDRFADVPAPAAPGGRGLSPKDRAKLPKADPVRSMGPNYKEPPSSGEEEHEEEVERARIDDDDKPARKAAPEDDDNRSGVASKEVSDSLDSFLDEQEGKGKEKAKAEKPASEDDSPTPDDIDREADAEVAKMKNNKELRQAHKAQLRARREVEGRMKGIEEKLAAAEARLKEAEEGAPLRSSEEIEKLRSSYEEKLRAADYIQSDEFQKQHYQPLEKALKAAYDEIDGVPVNEDGMQRPAKQDDFNALLRMSNFEAIKAAKELFGDYSSEVLAHRRDVMNRSKAMEEAKKGAVELSKEASKQRQLSEARQREQGMKAYRGQREALQKKYPGFFSEKEGDAEGNALLKNGLDLVETVITGMPDASDEVRLEKITQMHMRAAGFARLARDLKAARAELAEERKKREGYEASEPKGGKERSSDLDHLDGEDESIASRLDQHLANYKGR